MKYLLLYLALVPIFFVIDFIWLGYVAKDFYFKALDHLIAKPINKEAAVVFYLIYIVGIIIFAVIPGYQAGHWQVALMWGVLFGFFTYATYDLTNLATLRDWPIQVVVVDILWGMVLCGSVATAGYFVAEYLRI